MVLYLYNIYSLENSTYGLVLFSGNIVDSEVYTFEKLERKCHDSVPANTKSREKVEFGSRDWLIKSTATSELVELGPEEFKFSQPAILYPVGIFSLSLSFQSSRNLSIS